MAYVTNSQKRKASLVERLGFAIIALSILISSCALLAIAAESMLSNPQVQQNLSRIN
jgi:hypothetical protein